LLPNIQNNLHWHENFNTITTLQEEYYPILFLLKTNSRWRRCKPWKLQPSNAIWWTQIEHLNFDWLSQNQYILDWFESCTTQTRRKSTNSPTSFIDFGHWILLKLQHFELDLKLCEAIFGSVGCLAVNSYRTKAFFLWKSTQNCNFHSKSKKKWQLLFLHI